MASPNWARIRAEYLKGGVSYRQLAERYKVNLSTLEKRARREAWADDLRQTCGEVAAELPSRVAAVVLDEAEAWTRRSLEIAATLREEFFRQRTGTQIKIAGGPGGPERLSLPYLNEPKDGRAFIAALAEIDKMARLALRLDEKATDAIPAEDYARLMADVAEAVVQAAQEAVPDEALRAKLLEGIEARWARVEHQPASRRPRQGPQGG